MISTCLASTSGVRPGANLEGSRFGGRAIFVPELAKEFPLFFFDAY
jgi:hypothetical protein